MFIYEHKLRVLYADTDQMGYVYYGNYAYYYEQARSEAIRSAGISYKEIEESGTMMPITRMNIKYIQPAFYDELLTIKTFVSHLPHRIIVFYYEVYNIPWDLWFAVKGFFLFTSIYLHFFNEFL